MRGQRDNADIWIPLKQMLIDSGAITNEQQRAEVANHIELTRDAMKRGAALLDDISPDAYGPMAQSEETVYGFWKMLSEPPALIDENILVQTNAYISPDESRYPGRPATVMLRGLDISKTSLLRDVSPTVTQSSQRERLARRSQLPP